MMERVRILLVAARNAPVRGLVGRLQDPDVDVVVCTSAQEAVAQLRPLMPNLVIVDGSVPGRDVMRFYSRLRSTVTGSSVPLIFSSHDGSAGDQFASGAPDFYLGQAATLDDLEQLVFSFLPDSLVEVAPRTPDPEVPPDDDLDIPDDALRLLYGKSPPRQADSKEGAGEAAPALSLTAGPLPIALGYLAVYALGEVLGAAFDARLALIVDAGLLAALFFHGANTPAGPERSFYWTLWLAPLTRIYGLAQPFTGAPPLLWWALTTIPMAVAGLVALRLIGEDVRAAGLVPSLREAQVAVFMVPVGLALGVLFSLMLDTRAPARELASGGVALVALAVILNPGLVDEIVFRGALLRASCALLGNGLGIGYASLLYAPVVPVGLVTSASPVAVTLTFGVGAMLSFLTLRTGSILSAAVAHAALAVGLFVLAPALMPNGLAPASDGAPPAATPPAVVPTAPALATKPVLVVSPPATAAPTQLAPSGSPPQPNAPSTGGQPGQGSGLQLATPITLAPPGAPPVVPAGPSPQAAVPGAASSQIVVVRGTGGSGARLRAQPGNNGQILTVVPEYTPLVVIGQDRTVDGLVWRNVRAQNGAEGWIAANFLTAP